MSVTGGLTLVTGATGSGKTLFVVDALRELKDRPLFVHGVAELTIPHEATPAVAEWTEQRGVDGGAGLTLPYFAFPPGSIVVVDEAQRIFRPRAPGHAVPDYVAAFETRRHTGVDFVLITQHPALLDANIRRLVTRHVHVHSTYLGRYLLEWVGIGDPDSSTSRELAVRTRYKLPRRAFQLYKSAEVHTKVAVKRSWLVYAVPVLAVVAIALGWEIYGRVVSKSQVTQQVGQPGEAKVASGQGKAAPVTVDEYVASYRPRVPGLAHTAPRYDEIAQAVAVPRIAGCMTSGKSVCRCFDQRGFQYSTSQEQCLRWLASPPFYDFLPDGQVTAQPAPTVLPARTDAGILPKS